jgi:LacI family transcriptional regulator
MKPTLRDIATATGLSPTTVSLVLCNKGNISEETRNLVRRTAVELGYERAKKPIVADPNSGRTLGLLFVIDEAFSYLFGFIRPIIESLERRVQEDGYDVVLIPISHSSSDEEIFRKVIDSRVEAVASLHYGNINAFIRLEDHDIPIVVVMNNKHQDKYYSVCSDDFHGAYEGTKYLIDLGHQRLAYVGCDRFNLEALPQDRYIGFMKAVNASNLRFDESSKVDIDHEDQDILRTQIGSLFDQSEPPTGIFALDDELARRVLLVLEERGISVPEDVSIIAPGDVLDYTKPYTPRITTMRINTDLIGSTTGELLLNRIRHAKEKLYVLKVNQELVERGSCAPPRNR